MSKRPRVYDDKVKAEPAREKAYRQLYLKTKDRLDRLDDITSHLGHSIESLRARVRNLERKYANSNSEEL